MDYSADFSEDSIPDPMAGSSEDADDTGLCGQRREILRIRKRIAVLDSFAGEAAVMIGAGNGWSPVPTV